MNFVEQFKQKFAEAEKISDQLNQLEDEMDALYEKMSEEEAEEVDVWESEKYSDDDVLGLDDDDF